MYILFHCFFACAVGFGSVSFFSFHFFFLGGGGRDHVIIDFFLSNLSRPTKLVLN